MAFYFQRSLIVKNQNENLAAISQGMALDEILNFLRDTWHKESQEALRQIKRENNKITLTVANDGICVGPEEEWNMGRLLGTAKRNGGILLDYCKELDGRISIEIELLSSTEFAISADKDLYCLRLTDDDFIYRIIHQSRFDENEMTRNAFARLVEAMVPDAIASIIESSTGTTSTRGFSFLPRTRHAFIAFRELKKAAEQCGIDISVESAIKEKNN